MLELTVATKSRVEFIDITARIRETVEKSGVTDGWVQVFLPHTTAGVTINENADPDVVADMIRHLGKLVPEDGPYRHSEGNSDAHIKASLLGSSLTVPIAAGRLRLGTWQGVYFCEFDGPRSRRVWITIKG